MKMNMKLASVAISAGAACLLTASLASAQVQAEGQVGMGLPGAQQPQAAAATGDNDHDMMVGRLAVGYLGRRNMLIGGGDPVNPAPETVAAPVIGIRYWIDQMVGLDVGLGFSLSGGSQSFTPDPTVGTGTLTVDANTPTVFIVHAGLPLSLAQGDHYSFQIVPEMNVGFASRTVSPPPGTAPPVPPDLEHSGLHFDIGARAGAEIHFGFMGIPQLSLQGTVGLAYSMDNTSVTQPAYATVQETKYEESQWALGTSVQDNPWNIFTSNVAALYYF